MNNVRTVLADLPNKIGAFTILKDDFYTIVINQNLSREENEKSYWHEIDHIQNGDFEKKCSADLIEYFAHI